MKTDNPFPKQRLNSCCRVLMLFTAVLLLAISCTKQAPEFSGQISSSLPAATVDLTAMADVDWYLLTSKNEASLKAGEVMAYDRKAGAGHIQQMTARLSGDKALTYSALVDYQWSDGQRMQNLPPISPALSMIFGSADVPTGFDVVIDLPLDNLYLVVHGGCSGVVANIDAIVQGIHHTQPLPCQGENDFDDQYWTYQLQVEHAAGKRLELSINALDSKDGLPSLTVSGVMLATQPMLVL